MTLIGCPFFHCNYCNYCNWSVLSFHFSLTTLTTLTTLDLHIFTSKKKIEKMFV